LVICYLSFVHSSNLKLLTFDFLMQSLMGETTPVPEDGTAVAFGGNPQDRTASETPATDWLPKTALHRF
jgi:hypothetical protein